jgi:hypothetical protein
VKTKIGKSKAMSINMLFNFVDFDIAVENENQRTHLVAVVDRMEDNMVEQMMKMFEDLLD